MRGGATRLRMKCGDQAGESGDEGDATLSAHRVSGIDNNGCKHQRTKYIKRNIPVALSATVLLRLLGVGPVKAVLGEVLWEEVFGVWGGGLAGVAVVVLVGTGHCWGSEVSLLPHEMK